MSAKGYLSPEGVARFMRKGYYSPVGVARKLVKAYCSPDGVARLAWEAEGGTDSPTGVRAYLYNGVKLPELPKWDKTAYPCVCITQNGSGVIACHIHQAVVYALTDRVVLTAPYKNYLLSSDGTTWEYQSGSTGTHNATFLPLIWTDTDAYNKDGTELILEASDPVPLYNYNGVELPELPEWDRAAYPYAYIMYATNSVYYLAISATTQTSTVDGRKLLFGDWKYMYTDGAWTTTTAAGYGGDIVWSNYDMYYHERHESAGTVYCEASDPVPVYI